MASHSTVPLTDIVLKTNDFLIAEYEALRSAMRHHQTAYFALENYAFGGAIVTYGYLFVFSPLKPSHTVSSFACWSVFIALCLAFIRCLAHYLMVMRLARYLKKIEKLFYFDGSLVKGFEHRQYDDAPLTKSNFFAKFLGPWTNLMVNLFGWILLLGGCLWLTIANENGWTIR